MAIDWEVEYNNRARGARSIRRFSLALDARRRPPTAPSAAKDGRAELDG